LRARLDLAARISARRNFRNATAVKCHPEPAAKDLAAALFCGRDLPGFGGFARPHIEMAGKQANRSARNAPSEILRLRSG
jgi:hypothetical protein